MLPVKAAWFLILLKHYFFSYINWDFPCLMRMPQGFKNIKTMSERVKILKDKLCDLATENAEHGVKVKSARFRYNVNDRCTMVLLTYEEEDSENPEPLKMSEL